MASKWYRQGTISVTNASKDVVGVSTNWLDAGDKPMAGDVMVIAGQPYEIEHISDNESLSLFTPFPGATAENIEYAIIRNASINISTRIAAAVSNAINSKQQLLNEIDDFLISTEPTVIIHDSVGRPHAVKPIQTLAANLIALVGGSYNLDQMIEDAQSAAELSAKYANAPEGVEVEPGQHSAKHWAKKTEQVAATAEQVKADFESNVNQTIDEIGIVKQSILSVQENVEQKSLSATKAADNATEQAEIAKTQRQEAQQFVSQVAESASTVSDSLSLARKWADAALNEVVAVTPAGVNEAGEPTESETHYSAKHWAVNANQSNSATQQAKEQVEAAKTEIDQLQQQQVEQLNTVTATANGIKEDQVLIKSAITQAQRDLSAIQAAIDDVSGEIGIPSGDLGSDYRRLTDYNFTEPNSPLDIGGNKIVSGLTSLLFADDQAVNVGAKTRPLLLHVNSDNNIEAALPDGERKKIAWLSDLTVSGANGIEGEDGNITTITFDEAKEPSLPDLISRSSKIGSHVLRQFSGQANDIEQTLWHESVQGEHYSLSVGETGATEILSIDAKMKRAYINKRKVLVEGDAVGGGTETVAFEVFTSSTAIEVNKRALFDLESAASDLVGTLPNGQVGDSFAVGIYRGAAGRKLTLTPYGDQKVVGLAGGYDLKRDAVIIRFDYVDDVIGWNITNGSNLSYSSGDIDAKLSLVNADISQINSKIAVVSNDITGENSYNVTLSSAHFSGNNVLKINVAAGEVGTLVIPNGLEPTTPVMLVRVGEGDVIITGTESVVVHNSSQGNALAQPYSVASLLPLGNDNYVLIGDVTSLQAATFPDV